MASVCRGRWTGWNHKIRPAFFRSGTALVSGTAFQDQPTLLLLTMTDRGPRGDVMSLLLMVSPYTLSAGMRPADQDDNSSRCPVAPTVGARQQTEKFTEARPHGQHVERNPPSLGGHKRFWRFVVAKKWGQISHFHCMNARSSVQGFGWSSHDKQVEEDCKGHRAWMFWKAIMFAIQSGKFPKLDVGVAKSKNES